MRELIFKNLHTPSSKKRDISVEEVTIRNGLASTTQKRSLYFVRGVHHVKSKNQMDGWLEKKKIDQSLNKKFFHILRKSSSKSKEDKLICKMRGSFYAVLGMDVYDIVFVHSIKIQVKPEKKGVEGWK